VSAVLVLGEDTRAFLSVIRSLGRAGLEVHVAWCPWNSAALQSRYVRRAHAVPAYRPDHGAWLDAFNKLCREYRFEWIVPCTDATILPLQLHRGELDCADRVCLLPDDVFRMFSSKDETYALASAAGVPLPAQTTASTLAEVREAAEQFGYPLVLKPKTSATRSNPLARQMVEKARRPGDLEALAGVMLRGGEILVQRNFQGLGVGVEVLAKDGEILTAFQHERVHEPRPGGGSSYRRSVPLDPAMLDATRRLMRAVRYTGVAMVEFKVNPQAGKWVLIEVNARFWGSLPLSMAAGLDFPLYLYEMLYRGRTEFPQQYRLNVYSRHWSTDLQWLLGNRRADRSDPDVMWLPWRRIAGEIVNVALMRERSDTLVWDDPRPALGDLHGFLERKWFDVVKGMGMAREMRRREALTAVRSARQVTFVCHGNICRSPFAAAVLEQKSPAEITCRSSGCYPKEGRPSPDAAIAAARKFGVDLTGHRSSVMSQGDVDTADVIFVFERKNVDELSALFTGLEGKVHYLGALDGGNRLEIPDPYGGSVETFARCYERIAEIIERAWPTS
jgi:protein-tyrosine-phosphatase/predicted ATP-grasp superfamily ATP-dependent carboligase